jgi:cardiolipin synthase A/B
VLVAALLIVIAALVFIIWSQRRHREPRFEIDSDAPLDALLPSLVALSHGSLVDGNAVEVIENGAFFDAVLEDMRAAENSIHFETYIWEDGEAAGRLAAAMREKARSGVAVRLLVDAFGSKGMSDGAQRELEAAGCKVCRFHDGRLRKIGHQNERDHRKLCVIDGRIAFVGGHCVKDAWLGDAHDADHFRDISVRLRGPAVRAAQSTFSENWIEETGEVFVGDEVFPPLEPAGNVPIHFARVKPSGSAPPAINILYHLVICMARKRIYIQNPYFLPGERAIDALGAAVRRGVDVRIMVPAADASDLPIVQHAAHRNFSKLLSLGVRIFEYEKTLLHQKVITADGIWSSIGSANFDERSLGINDEIAAGFVSAELAERLEHIFREDLRHAVELELSTWEARGFWHRCKDNAAYVLKYQL